MANSRRPEFCEICDKKSFLIVLKCSHKICLDCKIMIKKVEKENGKCPWCRIRFQPWNGLVEIQKKKTVIDWSQYTPDFEPEPMAYNCELHEELAWR